MPLRGKILNIERRDEAAMYKNEEIQNLILGLGLGVKVASAHFPWICQHSNILADQNVSLSRGRILGKMPFDIIRSSFSLMLMWMVLI